MENLFKLRQIHCAIDEAEAKWGLHVISLTIFKQPSQYDGDAIRKNKVPKAIWGCEVNSTPAREPGCRENEGGRDIQHWGDEEC